MKCIMHRPYETVLKHRADFRVKYRFRSEAEGGRKTIPFQGIRCDFSYSDKVQAKQYIIFPEFESDDGKIIMENDRSVPSSGTALMWIVIPERRILHREIIKIGTKCFFREGDKCTADCEVIEIIDLFSNPIEKK